MQPLSGIPFSPSCVGDVCVVPPNGLPSEPALRAHLRHMRELRPGLTLHADAAHAPRDFTAQAEMNEALRIVLLLEGAIDVSYGTQHVRLNTGSSRCGTAVPPTQAENALMVSVAEPELFVRRARRNSYARRVSMGLTHEWIEQATGGAAAPVLQNFMRRHLSLQFWQTSERARAIAEQIVHPPVFDPLMQNLYLESRTLELVAEAFGALDGAPTMAASSSAPATAGLRPHEHRRLRELREFLSGSQADGLSLDDIARHAGINANTLQRQFRTLYGVTIFDHLRESRLQRARAALERGGLTVGQAADVAGYSSAANFATAYRRRFGLAPKLARSRI